MRRVAGNMVMVAAWLLILITRGWAQESNVHYYHQGAMPPGAIGSQQLQRGGPLPGYYQPVEIKSPSGALISLAVEGRFEEPRQGLRKAGMLIGSVYRLRVTGIPLAEGQEVFPTIEIIDRLFTPIGQEHRFSIPVELSEEDIKLALAGKFVTRVIYVEDPRNALPVRDDTKNQRWFEVAPGQDPLAMADVLGRPVAILRLGGRVPDLNAGPDPQFFYGCPPFVDYPDPSPPIEQMMPVKTVRTMPKSAVKAKAKPQVKAVPKPAAVSPLPLSSVGAQGDDAPASKSQEQDSKTVRTIFEAESPGNSFATPERGNDAFKSAFKFEPKTPVKPDVKILPPPPAVKTSVMSESSAQEGPRS